jgi:hypothetical protein
VVSLSCRLGIARDTKVSIKKKVVVGLERGPLSLVSTIGGRSVGIVGSRTKATELGFFCTCLTYSPLHVVSHCSN